MTQRFAKKLQAFPANPVNGYTKWENLPKQGRGYDQAKGMSSAGLP